MIRLAGVDPVDGQVKDQAFPKPAAGDVIHYWWATPSPAYKPYLVQVSEFDGRTVVFRGIHLVTGDLLPTNLAGDKDYIVQLEHTELAWGGPPSTLTKWDATNNCAILFLNDVFVLGKNLKDAKGDNLASDPPKYPRGSGTIDALLRRVKRFQDEAGLTEAQVTTFQEVFKEHMDSLANL